MVFLDANVFLYAAGASDPYREPCRRVLRKVEEGSLPSNTSAEVVQELLYVLWRRGLAEKGIRLARSVIDLFPELLPHTRDDLRDACGLLGRNPALTPRDAIHVATMRRHGIDTILSADVHFDGIRGIRRVDPARIGS
jgi:predicted nucleic acid-binding protein